jgi:hypothetical protein
VTWLAWRQQRYVVGAMALLATALAGWALKDGYQIQSLLHQWNAAPCKGGNGFAVKYQSFCVLLVHSVASSESYRNVMAALCIALPLILGIALGVSALGGELERKTVRLAWTQSVTRTKWLLNKVAVSIGSILLILTPLSLVSSWWVHASDIASRVSPTGFSGSGWMIAVFGIFSFAVSLFLGLIFRRPSWAAGTAVLLIVVFSFFVSTHIRPHLVALSMSRISMATTTKGSSTFVIEKGGAPKNAWLLFQGLIPVDSSSLPSSAALTVRRDNASNKCQLPGGNVVADQETYCLKKLGLKNVALYVADNQFWNLQLREGGIYLALAGLFVGLSAYGVKRINT